MKKYKLIALLIILTFLIGCSTNENDEYEADQEENTTEDERETYKGLDFLLPDYEGNEYSLEDYEGKIVFVNFWGTWCPPCLSEMPHFQTIYEKYEDEIEILAINVQTIPDEKSKDEVMEYVNENEFTYPILFDEEGYADSLGINAFPTTFIINQEGENLGYVPGAMTEYQMDQTIRDLLK